ncbi:MAG TPA: carboxy terminal-processing peptidase [Spirochaetota bacterium]|nr:carboxy terminal-processing peptidase [Spirochaetota bacterium]
MKKLTFVCIALVLFSGCYKKSVVLNPNDIHYIISTFLNEHVQYHEFNNTISDRTLNNLLSSIDPGKYYFYKNDVDGFTKRYSTLIDDLSKKEDFSFLDDIFGTYRKRVAEVNDMINQLLKQQYTFTEDETINLDSDKISYAIDKKELKERWRKNIKLQLLNYQTTDNLKEEQAKEKLKRKFFINNKRIQELDKAKQFSIFLNAFSMALDPHTNYLTQEEHEDFMISNNLKLEGIGVQLRSEDGYTIVDRIIPGGAADKLPKELQLQPNDRIVAVAQDNDEPVDVVDMDLRDVVKMIRGKKGTLVKLTIIRINPDSNEQKRMVIPIVREEINLEDSAVKSEVHQSKNGMVIGYIKIPSFYVDITKQGFDQGRSSTADTIMQINNLMKKNVACIVIDLRGNPGGALSEALKLAGLFVDAGPIMQVYDSSDTIQSLDDPIPGVYYSGPLVVLIDKFSASASEIFAGAIRDYRRGIIIGTDATFGKGTVQSYKELYQKKGAIKITNAIFYQPSGTSNQLNGIKPDITVPDITTIWDIGENKLKYALQWKPIPPAAYTPYRNYIPGEVVALLRNKSDSRLQNDAHYVKLLKEIQELKQKLQSKEISLKDESTIEQRKKDLEGTIRKNKTENLIDLENDPFLKEALNITVDYIKVLQ